MPVFPSVPTADLASLLCSRICHDLISPIGAVSNAMELYDEGEAMAEALHLAKLASMKASARLQFAKFAFGAIGQLPMESDEAKAVALCYMKYEKTQLTWQAKSIFLAENEVKLLLNLIFLSNACLPRGGEIIVTFSARKSRNNIPFCLICNGQIIRIPKLFMKLYHGQFFEPITAHTVQFYYTLLLSKNTGRLISIEQYSNQIQFSVK